MLGQLIFRPATLDDLDAVYELSKEATLGLSTLLNDRDVLEARLAKSVRSFKKSIVKPVDELYFFVLEDVVQKKIAGTASIWSVVGVDDPFYSYKIVRKKNTVSSTKQTTWYHELHLKKEMRPASEIGTLYLSPEYRQKGVGRFLSTARFLFMAKHMDRFKSNTIAELRGVSDSSGYCPFWDNVMKPFFGMSFREADVMSQHSKSFIEDCIPSYPLVLETLAPRVQRIVGQTHQLTAPAQKILESEGFHVTDCIDIFDAGPKMKVKTNQISAINRRKSFQDYTLTGPLKHKNEYILSSGVGTSFRAGCTKAVEKKDGSMNIQDEPSLSFCLGNSRSLSHLRLYPNSRRSLNLSVPLKTQRVRYGETAFLTKFSKWYDKVSHDQLKFFFG